MTAKQAHDARRDPRLGSLISHMIMADYENDLVAIPRLAERVGLTPRVLRYWEEQGIISPSIEHGRLRYSPRDEAIARLVKRLLELSDHGIDGIRMLRREAEREVRGASGEIAITEAALRTLYARKAFCDVVGLDPERLGEPAAGRAAQGRPAPPRHPPPPPPRPQVGPWQPPERPHPPHHRPGHGHTHSPRP
jgi:DNA-binding transcriptional MerR regulator